MAYCFGWSLGCLSYPAGSSDPLDKLDFHHPVLVSVEQFISLQWWFKWFPILHIMATSLPEWILERTNEGVQAVTGLNRSMQDQIDQFVNAQEAGNEGKLQDVDHQLIFRRLLTIGRGSTGDKHEQPLSNQSIIEEVNIYHFLDTNFCSSTENMFIE